MPPMVACPNCGQDEWLESPALHYFPQVDQSEDGTYRADTRNGIHARVWRCNNCLFMMPFWEPD